MIVRVLLVMLGLTAAGACRGVAEPPSSQKLHPLLADLKPPPLNRPLLSPSIEPQPPKLPPGNQPALFLVSNGRPFTGTVTISGRLTVDSGRIELIGERQARIEILYRLPSGLSVSPGSDVGSLTVTELSNPGGPNRRVILQRQSSLLLAHIWLKSSEPVVADLGAGLRLGQLRVPESTPGSQTLAGAEVLAFDGEQRIAAIPVATPMKIQVRAGGFQVFVGTSCRAYSAGRWEEQDAGAAYILEAWVVRSE